MITGGVEFGKQTPFIEARSNMKRRRRKTSKEKGKRQVAGERPSGEDENRAHKSLDFDPAAQTNGWQRRRGSEGWSWWVSATDAPAEET